ncbi:GH36-type glycosyl hydrolase domain-containing protein [Anaeromicropila herbilytica]|uniref:Cellobiose phosphorylase n=1 Tax=Anaeromicropila herbilytica TaxID=2785025 RepID=A0A7R7ENH8_9FIRM|nr:hypothetical protein bsdtb5_34950 [Anaeromicropila herbilytica]
MKSVVNPYLSGDFKTSQNSFLLQPISSEELHANKVSRNFWCNVKGKGEWSATGVSSSQQAKVFTREEEEVTLRAGVLWHSIHRVSKDMGLSSSILSFVPMDHQVEIMKVDIQNISNEEITFTATAAIPLYCRSADNIRDHRHVTSLLHRIKTTGNSIIVNPTLTFDERGHKKNELLYYVSGSTGEGECPKGFFPCVEKYIGEGGSFERPEAIIREKEPVGEGIFLDGYEAMGGIQFEPCTLKPGEEKSFIIRMGIATKESVIEEVGLAYSTVKDVMNALEQAKEHWEKKQNVYYETGDADFNQFMYWVSVQPILRRIYGCSFLPHHDYGKGGRGWRDLWQDCLALLIMNPNGVRKMLIDNFAGVRMDGTNATIIGEQQGEFIADRNNITRVWMDHGVWPLITTNFYIEQTGDIDILLEENTYFYDKQVVRGEEIDTTFTSDRKPCLIDKENHIYRGSILEHLLVQHLTAYYDVGEHNHMRLRGADWNDALDMADQKGESVAFTAAYAGNLITLAKLIQVLEDQKGMKEIKIVKELGSLLQEETQIYDDVTKKKECLHNYCYTCKQEVSGDFIILSSEALARDLTKKAEWIKEHIKKNEWITVGNHSWFNGYYDNHGRRVEGEFEKGNRMMLTSQVFTIMSDTATKEQVEAIIKAADEYLYEEKVGGYRLNTNFYEVKDDLGRMFGFAYGHKENGAVFSHMAVMYANALYKRGYAKEGYKVIHALYQQVNNFEVSRIYPGIPEYFNEEGRGMYHYLTGAASWLMLTVITEMFGVKGSKGNLVFEPKLLKQQFNSKNNASLTMNFANRNLRVTYQNVNEKEYGDYQIMRVLLNGEDIMVTSHKGRIDRKVIEGLEADRYHEIVVLLE